MAGDTTTDKLFTKPVALTAVKDATLPGVSVPTDVVQVTPDSPTLTLFLRIPTVPIEISPLLDMPVTGGSAPYAYPANVFAPVTSCGLIIGTVVLGVWVPVEPVAVIAVSGALSDSEGVTELTEVVLVTPVIPYA
jgi:hypothetical protein